MNRINKKSKYLTLRCFEIGYGFKFDPIKSYLEKTQDMIHKQEEELIKKFEEWNNEHKGDLDFPDAYDVYDTEVINFSEFSELLNQSIYLTIYSTFESEFFSLCVWCQNAENLNHGPKDIKGRNYIGQCRKYIIKDLNINLDNLNSQWNEIVNYQKIRNAIAHNNAILKENNEAVVTFITMTDGIFLDPKDCKIKIDSIIFLTDFIDKLVSFLIRTIEEIIYQKETAST